MSQRHECQRVIIAGGCPIKIYHCDKNEMNVWQWLEKGWHFYVFTYWRTRTEANIKLLQKKLNTLIGERGKKVRK